MNIQGKHYTSLWYDEKEGIVKYIDQTKLPWELVVKELHTLEDVERAIVKMEVRGAPLIGVTAAFGIFVGVQEGRVIQDVYDKLRRTRPTAVNLRWALDQMMHAFHQTDDEDVSGPFHCHSRAGGNPLAQVKSSPALLAKAIQIRQSEIDRSLAIGQNGLQIIKNTFEKTRKPVNILTHCNAGFLATIDYGTATAPIYLAHDQGIPVHVWVDETRPRNQGAKITAFELHEHGVPCTLIPDNTGGHLMQNGLVDLVIVGTDRVAANGDVANKIGTYLKALAAHDNNVPFYVAMPFSSYDADTATGSDIEIEERVVEEVLVMEGIDASIMEIKKGPHFHGDDLRKIYLTKEGIQAANYGFDITPAKFVTAYITEKGLYTSPMLGNASLE